MARAKVLEARRAANAERAAREAATVDLLAGLLAELDALGELDSRTEKKIAELQARTGQRITALKQELTQRSEEVRQRAKDRAFAHEAAAGAALRALRGQDETVASIAAQTGQSQSRLRTLLKVQTPGTDRGPADSALKVVAPEQGAASENAAPGAPPTEGLSERQPAAPLSA